MKLEVYTRAGKKTGRSLALPADFLIKKRTEDADSGAEHAMYLDVKRYLASQRQGTHKTKERGEVRGSTRKIKKQKGTGTARAGGIRSPLFRGGGVTFGPKPREYRLKINKKVKQLARRAALSEKIHAKALSFVEAFDFEAPKTKTYQEFLAAFSLLGKKVLLVSHVGVPKLFLSARNLPHAHVCEARLLNTYEILRHEHVIIFEEALETLKKLCVCDK